MNEAQEQTRNLWPLLLSIITLSIIVVLICYFSSQGDSSLQNLRDRGFIRIGYAVEAPYAFLDANGDVTGESPELAKWVVSQLGIPNIEWIHTDFDNLIPELIEGRFDLIAAGMFITAERAEMVAFSEPCFHVQQGLLVAAGNPHQLGSYIDILSNPELKIAVITGAIEETLLSDIGIPAAQILHVPDARTGETAVKTAIADAFALSSVSVRWMALNDQSQLVEMAEPFEQIQTDAFIHYGYGGFAFRQSDKNLLNGWNAVLADFVSSPEHLQLIEEFGFSSVELSISVSTGEIIE
jgi:polar amino acid transport system substrate-binding protein